MKKDFLAKHFDGMGGINALLPIAVPMIFANVFETAITVIDRLFLSYTGKAQMAACMNGGLTAWTCMTLFIGIVSYVSAMVARSYGAGKKGECVSITYQGIYFALLSYPLILLIGYFASNSFVWAGHDALEVQNERIYFWYLIFGDGLFVVLRMALSSFFSGIGKTRVILRIHAMMMVLNLSFNYIFIFGKLGCPALGIHGAAIGRLLASLLATGAFFFVFIKYSRKKEYANSKAMHFNRHMIRPLLRFGVPNGLDNMLSTSAFTVAISSLHGFGTNAAAALTVIMNWDLCAYLPMLGIQIGIITLVSQCLGVGNKKEAERAVFSGLKLNLCYLAVLLTLFLGIPRILVGLFTPGSRVIDYSEVVTLAIPMLRSAAFYLFFEGIYISFRGALRGGGGTLWAMIVGIAFHWLMAGVLLVSIHVIKWPMLNCWYTWVAASVVGTAVMYLRFKTGKWKCFDILENHKTKQKAVRA
ncbi:MAG: MATE family efflux transporter [Lentisphaeria bacterium]